MEPIDEYFTELVARFAKLNYPSSNQEEQVATAYYYASRMIGFLEAQAEMWQEPQQEKCPEHNVEYVTKQQLNLDGQTTLTFCPICGKTPETKSKESNIGIATEVSKEDREG